MDQFTEDRDGPGFSLAGGEGDGVPDSEAHAEMFRAEDLHGFIL